MKKVRTQNFEEAFLAVNNIADFTISMEPAPKPTRDTSNCTALSSVPLEQSQELRKNDSSINNSIHKAPNGTAVNSHSESSNNLHNQVKN